MARPDQASPQQILALQRQYGNRAVNRIIQARLVVGASNDPAEREAEYNAAHVLRQAARTPHTAAKAGQTRPVSRMPRGARSASLQTGPAIEAQLAASRGRGSPLPAELQTRMESGIGAGFSKVRLHTGSEASQLNRQLQARAFTCGSDIYLGEGEYRPASASGQSLLAHELTHVVQQGAAAPQGQTERGAGQPAQVQRLPFAAGGRENDADADSINREPGQEGGPLGEQAAQFGRAVRSPEPRKCVCLLDALQREIRRVDLQPLPMAVLRKKLAELVDLNRRQLAHLLTRNDEEATHVVNRVMDELLKLKTWRGGQGKLSALLLPALLQREIVVLDPHGVEVHTPRDDLRRPGGASVGRPTNGRLVVVYDGKSYLVARPLG